MVQSVYLWYKSANVLSVFKTNMLGTPVGKHCKWIPLQFNPEILSQNQVYKQSRLIIFLKIHKVQVDTVYEVLCPNTNHPDRLSSHILFL